MLLPTVTRIVIECDFFFVMVYNKFSRKMKVLGVFFVVFL